MAEQLFSPSWYRVANLKPRLRSHAQIHRHDYRDDVWYVLQDTAGGRSYRFTPAVHYVIGLMDGARTVDEIWEAATARLGEDAPTQVELIRLLGQLHSADALQSDVPPDAEELFRRYQRQQRTKWKRRVWNPLAVRFPFWDPDRFLERWLPVVRPLFGPLGLILWLTVVGAGAVLAGMHWSELTHDVTDRVLTLHNLFLLWLTYPIVKALHELGHGFATKNWGGEVHEIGIMLLVLMPVPYVDASSAWAFRDKHKRVVVGASGILVELFLAAVALILWVYAEPGIVRNLAYNVMFIGGVSTLLFNGNPLLRFDGYYVFSDLVEIPNLGTRSNKYFLYLFQKYLGGITEAKSPAVARGETAWFLVYGIASFAYRMFILFVIILFIGGKFFVVGVLLAAWAATTQLLLPVLRGVRFVLTSPQLEHKRARAVAATGFLVGALAAVVFVLPMPLTTRAEGVVWMPEQSQVRAGTNGFVRELLAGDGEHVATAQPLIATDDPLLQTRVQLLEARLRELEARLAAKQFTDRTGAEIIRQKLSAAEADLRRAAERERELLIQSPLNGTLVVADAVDLPGRYVRQGEVLGYVLDSSAATARVVVGQADIGLVRERTQGVEVWLAGWQTEPVAGVVKRGVPAATDRLPSAALGTFAGGRFPVDPGDPHGLTSLERVFQLDIELPAETAAVHTGQRVAVRFDHGYEPLGMQAYRALRQLFLHRFGV